MMIEKFWVSKLFSLCSFEYNLTHEKSPKSEAYVAALLFLSHDPVDDDVDSAEVISMLGNAVGVAMRDIFENSDEIEQPARKYVKIERER